jgi:hypothetical protein
MTDIIIDIIATLFIAYIAFGFFMDYVAKKRGNPPPLNQVEIMQEFSRKK